MFRSHVQLLFTLGSDSKLRDCEYIYISLFWDSTLDSHSYCVLSVDQVFFLKIYICITVIDCLEKKKTLNFKPFLKIFTDSKLS